MMVYLLPVLLSPPEAARKEETEELLSVADQIIDAAEGAQLDLWTERVLTAPTLVDVLGDG